MIYKNGIEFQSSKEKYIGVAQPSIYFFLLHIIIVAKLINYIIINLLIK